MEQRGSPTARCRRTPEAVTAYVEAALTEGHQQGWPWAVGLMPVGGALVSPPAASRVLSRQRILADTAGHDRWASLGGSAFMRWLSPADQRAKASFTRTCSEAG
jgi:hypothetical protein